MIFVFEFIVLEEKLEVDVELFSFELSNVYWDLIQLWLEMLNNLGVFS